METGHVVRFASQPHPFLVETTPRLDLDCHCSIMQLAFSEIVPAGSPPRDRLTFTLRVSLLTWLEHDPPPRSLEVESLVREFLARLPAERIHELAEEFERARKTEKWLKSFSLTGEPDELVRYSQLVDERGGVREGVTEHAYFFVFEGREFLVEDHYCANPPCDCRQVHLEFWERVEQFHPQRRLSIQQRLMATFTLAGRLQEVRFSQESASTTKYLLRAWTVRCSHHFRECRRRYDLIKAVGARSFPSPPSSRGIIAADEPPRLGKRRASGALNRHVRRNDPCPCGSGLKFKRCCARRSAVAD